MFSLDVLQRLGFEPDGSNGAVRRTDRHELRVTFGSRGVGAGEGAASVQTTRLDVRTRERLRESFQIRWKHAPGLVNTSLGVPELDRWLDAWCVEPTRVPDLAARGAFDVLREMSPWELASLRMDDEGLSATSAWNIEGDLLLGTFVGWGERACDRLREIVFATPPAAWQLSVDDGWAAAATLLGGTYEQRERALSGVLHARAFRAAALGRADGHGGWWTACKVDVPGAFAAPGQPEALFTWQQGGPLPELAIVRSGRAPKLLALLPRVAHVQLRAGLLRVSHGGLIIDPAALDAFVRACVDAALELSVPDGDAPGPYR